MAPLVNTKLVQTMKKLFTTILTLTLLYMTHVVPISLAQSPSRISINSVSVADFTKNPLAKAADGSILIASEDGFQIVYFPQFDHEFLLDIQISPFPAIREKAEKKLLAVLSISQADACKLYVVVATSSKVNPQWGAKNYSLSFCESTVRADVNADGSVNTIDYALVIKQYGKTQTDVVPQDVNRDFKIDAVDLSSVVERLGNTE